MTKEKTKDYSKCIIYKLKSIDEKINDFYVGHTIEGLIIRMNKHRYNYKMFPNRYVYDFIKKNGGISQWFLEKIEDYPCANKKEAELREEYYSNLLGAGLNKKKNIVMTAEKQRLMAKEYYLKNKEKWVQYQREWRKNNPEKYKMYNKKINRKPRESLSTETTYEKKSKTYFDCPCGSLIKNVCLKKHNSSKKHLDYLNQANSNN